MPNRVQEMGVGCGKWNARVASGVTSQSRGEGTDGRNKKERSISRYVLRKLQLIQSHIEQEIRSVEHGICPIAEFTSP